MVELTNHHPLVLWHCWSCVFEMTDNVSSGTLNPTIPYLTIQCKLCCILATEPRVYVSFHTTLLGNHYQHHQHLHHPVTFCSLVFIYLSVCPVLMGQTDVDRWINRWTDGWPNIVAYSGRATISWSQLDYDDYNYNDNYFHHCCIQQDHIFIIIVIVSVIVVITFYLTENTSQRILVLDKFLVISYQFCTLTQTGQCDCHIKLQSCSLRTSVSWPSSEKQSLKFHIINKCWSYLLILCAKSFECLQLNPKY